MEITNVRPGRPKKVSLDNGENFIFDFFEDKKAFEELIEGKV